MFWSMSPQALPGVQSFEHCHAKTSEVMDIVKFRVGSVTSNDQLWFIWSMNVASGLWSGVLGNRGKVLSLWGDCCSTLRALRDTGWVEVEMGMRWSCRGHRRKLWSEDGLSERVLTDARAQLWQSLTWAGPGLSWSRTSESHQSPLFSPLYSATTWEPEICLGGSADTPESYKSGFSHPPAHCQKCPRTPLGVREAKILICN